MPRLIKYYQNRKFYDTYRKQYITLAEISNLILTGEDLRILDHSTGDDVTLSTLRRAMVSTKQKDGDVFSLLDFLMELILEQILFRKPGRTTIASRYDLDLISSQIDSLSKQVDELVLGK